MASDAPRSDSVSTMKLILDEVNTALYLILRVNQDKSRHFMS